MIADRTDLNKKLSIESHFPPFFSALIPEIGRPDYVTECVNRIHQYADVPVEIILHDDGSGEKKQRILYDRLRDKVSTFIFNMGFNTGLARAMNRCKMMASSNYLIGFNSDVYLTSSFLGAMMEVLEKPYVGLVNVTPKIGDGPGAGRTRNGHKMALMKGTGCCHCYGIKKETWEKVNGWDENVQTTASDVGFVGSLFGAGLFAVAVEGTITNEMWPKSPDGKVNIGGTNPNYVECGQFCRNDNNVPPIFKMGDHAQRCENRREAIWHGVNDAQNAEELYPQWYNGKFQNWCIGQMFPNDQFINWEFAKKFGHDKWKDMIIKDFNL